MTQKPRWLRGLFVFSLDLRAWSKDVDHMTARVEALTAAGPSPELERAAVALKSLLDTPVAGYRRTRKARHLLWEMDC